MAPATKQSVLFVCTHNSARSQMAEALLKDRYGTHYDAESAGTEPSRVHPLAVDVMREVGIDISDQTSTSVPDSADSPRYDIVVTVCDAARETCPYLPALERNLHHAFPDPSSAKGSDAERLQVFRNVRDEISAWIDRTFRPT